MLRIEGSNGPEEIEFLGESELPEHAKQSHASDEGEGALKGGGSTIDKI